MKDRFARSGNSRPRHTLIPFNRLLAGIAEKHYQPHKPKAKVEKQDGRMKRKFTDDEIRAIRTEQMPIKALAEKYGDSYEHMYHIVTGQIYRFVI